ncbi:MAG: hypothetical protein EZS28_015577 [Streblomastix strix]|uniref:Uncharacterized protein n=1 Tax=Streblomastix strix TaxID=222440 RepID=A0A5J4W1Y9_9EUKA|nr:MAG: hypothetical protein EZS28_015577 [Streblomastix strix]
MHNQGETKTADQILKKKKILEPLLQSIREIMESFAKDRFEEKRLEEIESIITLFCQHTWPILKNILLIRLVLYHSKVVMTVEKTLEENWSFAWIIHRRRAGANSNGIPFRAIYPPLSEKQISKISKIIGENIQDEIESKLQDQFVCLPVDGSTIMHKPLELQSIVNPVINLHPFPYSIEKDVGTYPEFAIHGYKSSGIMKNKRIKLASVVADAAPANITAFSVQLKSNLEKKQKVISQMESNLDEKEQFPSNMIRKKRKRKYKKSIARERRRKRRDRHKRPKMDKDINDKDIKQGNNKDHDNQYNNEVEEDEEEEDEEDDEEDEEDEEEEFGDESSEENEINAIQSEKPDQHEDNTDQHIKQISNNFRNDTLANLMSGEVDVIPFFSPCFGHKGNLIVNNIIDSNPYFAKAKKKLEDFSVRLRKKEIRNLIGALRPEFMQHRWFCLIDIIEFIVIQKEIIDRFTGVDIRKLIDPLRPIIPLIDFIRRVGGKQVSVKYVLPLAFEVLQTYEYTYVRNGSKQIKKFISLLSESVMTEIMFDPIAICSYGLSTYSIYLRHQEQFFLEKLDTSNLNLSNYPYIDKIFKNSFSC